VDADDLGGILQGLAPLHLRGFALMGLASSPDDLRAAVLELLDYQQTSRKMAQRLQALEPVPLACVSAEWVR